RDGNPGEVPGAQSDNLGNYSKATFKSYLNSVFQLHTVYGIVEVTLTDVGDLQSSRGGEAFSLLFLSGSRAMLQGTYPLPLPSLARSSRPPALARPSGLHCPEALPAHPQPVVIPSSPG